LQLTHQNLNYFSYKIRAGEAKYCKEQGKFYEFTGTILPSGVEPEEFDFRFLNYIKP